MFMVTIPKSGWKKALAVLGCAGVLAGVWFGAGNLFSTVRATAAVAQSTAAGGNVKTAQDMADYLLGYGIEADVGTAQVLQVTIPKKFDKSFQAFNEVVQQMGMDLSKYKGKLAEKWVLHCPNRTVEEQTAYAVLLVRNSKVIGGYLLYQPSGEVLSLYDTLERQTLSLQPVEEASEYGAEETTAQTQGQETGAEASVQSEAGQALPTRTEVETVPENAYPID